MPNVGELLADLSRTPTGAKLAHQIDSKQISVVPRTEMVGMIAGFDPITQKITLAEDTPTSLIGSLAHELRHRSDYQEGWIGAALIWRDASLTEILAASHQTEVNAFEDEIRLALERIERGLPVDPRAASWASAVLGASPEKRERALHSAAERIYQMIVVPSGHDRALRRDYDISHSFTPEYRRALAADLLAMSTGRENATELVNTFIRSRDERLKSEPMSAEAFLQANLYAHLKAFAVFKENQER